VPNQARHAREELTPEEDVSKIKHGATLGAHLDLVGDLALADKACLDDKGLLELVVLQDGRVSFLLHRAVLDDCVGARGAHRSGLAL
jgi:hypothetical protein